MKEHTLAGRAFVAAVSVAAGLALSACQQGTAPAPRDQPVPMIAAANPTAMVTPAYSADLDNICNSIERSGASAYKNHDRVVTSAQWLGSTIQTDDGRNFLVTFGQADPTQKATILRAEARRAGILVCPLADQW